MATINGTKFDDRITGTFLNDVINGLDGNDHLDGGSGHDQLNGGAGDDVMIGGRGLDTLTGGAGDDILEGGADADAMMGGIGDDIYVVDNVGDTVSEGKNEGLDRVYARISYALPSNIEVSPALSTAPATAWTTLSGAIRSTTRSRAVRATMS